MGRRLPIRSLDQLWEHAPIGALPGEVVLAIGFFSSTPGAAEFEAYVEPVKIPSRYKASNLSESGQFLIGQKTARSPSESENRHPALGSDRKRPQADSACAILGRMKSSPSSPAVVQLAKLVCSRHGDDPRSYPTEEDRWLAILEELNLVLEVLEARASATSMVSAIEMQHAN